MKKRLLALLILGLLAGSYYAFGLGQYFQLAYLKSIQADIAAALASHPLRVGLGYFLSYILVTGLSLPGAALMTLAGGAIFGLFWGTLLVSFASAIGATVAFLVARFLLRDWVQARFGEQLRGFNREMEKDGAFYLFSLRLVPVVPFFVLNLVMGLTPIRIPAYYLVSQLGMLPATLVYVNAGTELAKLDSLSGILSPSLILSFALLGLLPLIGRKLVEALQARKVYQGWQRPDHYDRNLIVIGAGSGGLVSAYIAAAVRARVSLIEQHRMGGDCLNTGCVPSKALLRTARFLHDVRRASALGVREATAEVDFAEVMQRVQRVIAEVAPHDSVARYSELGVDCIRGQARITSPWSVAVNGRSLTTRAIVIASGARPFIPPIEGIEAMGYLTSDNVWALRQRPDRLLVLGGGPIGCELTQGFARLGSQVTQVEMLPRLMPREDPDISERVLRQFRKEGITVLLAHRAERFLEQDGHKVLVCSHAGGEARIAFDQVLVAVGRRASTEGLGLEDLGIPLTPQGTIEVNDHLQTRYPNITACGDVAGPYQFTHTAAHQAWYATVNGLFGALKRFRVDYSVIPWATFTDPEVARVGLNESEAGDKGIAYELTTYGFEDLDRAIADETAEGLVKVLTVPGKDRILGVTIAGAHAGELIGEFVAAMKNGIGLNRILGTIHIYPTLAEANKYVAGNWKRAHAPERLLDWLARYHAWRLGRPVKSADR